MTTECCTLAEDLCFQEQSAAPKRLHRLSEVRQLEGVSRRSLARRMGVSVNDIRRDEKQDPDLRLSTLFRWQKALGVPFSDLLVEPDDSLSPPLSRRAQLVRVMKTALAAKDAADLDSVRLLVNELIEQLQEIMPELKGVQGWQVVGQRRSRSELGTAFDRTLSEDVFMEIEN